MYPMLLLCHTAKGEISRTDFMFSEEKTDGIFLLSGRDEGESVVKNGLFAGCGINEILARLSREETRDRLPLCIKFINTSERMPVTVYPDSEYAKAHGDGLGKASLLYITDADKDAEMVYGLSRAVSAEELRRRVQTGSLSAVCNFVSVQKGDVFFIPPGVVFAIGSSIAAVQISTNSDSEYIISDYGRSYDGSPRPLQADKALDVMSGKQIDIAYGNTGDITLFPFGTVRELCVTDDFSVDVLSVDGNVGFYEETQTVSMIVLSGEADVSYSLGTMHIKAGDSILLPPGVKVRLSGKTEIIYTKFI